ARRSRAGRRRTRAPRPGRRPRSRRGRGAGSCPDLLALAEPVQGDVDQHVLLAAYQLPAAGLAEQLEDVDVVVGGDILGVPEEARVDARVAERQGLAIDLDGAVLQWPHQVVGGVLEGEDRAAGLPAEAVGDGDEGLDRRVAGAGAVAGERGVDAV